MVDGPRSSGTLRKSGRNVSIRTVASSQAASANVAAGQSPVVGPTIAGSGDSGSGGSTWRPSQQTPTFRAPDAQIRSTPRDYNSFYDAQGNSVTDPSTYVGQLYDQTGSPWVGTINAMDDSLFIPQGFGQANLLPPTRRQPVYSEDSYGYNSKEIHDSWMTTAQETLAGIVDPDQVSSYVEDLWTGLESMRITNKAIADQMIADAIDEAAQPYDEKLTMVGRSIDDVRGKMDDLEKITDYYQASIVEAWDRAAEAGRNTTGGDIRSRIAGRIADVGRVYDLSNANTQAYLDRIGGVPAAQKVAINDAIREMQSPFEGLTDVESTAAARIVDATGNLYAKQAVWGLANAKWEAEAQRFVTGSSLDRALDDLEQERDDIIGFRARAISRANRQAEQQYGYTETLPTLDEYRGIALSGLGPELGMSQDEFVQFMDGFQGLMDGSWVDTPLVDYVPGPDKAEWLWADDGTLKPVAFNTMAQLEKFLSALENPDGEFDKDIEDWLHTMAVLEETDKSWNERNQYYKSGGSQKKGSQAPNNFANKDTPPYLQRKAYTSGMQQQILSLFDVYSNGMADQMRYVVDPSNPDQDPNSDHLSGGALDIWPVDGNYDELDRLDAWLNTLPNVSFTRWRTGGHHDHLHVSFFLPDQIGGQPLVGDEGYVRDEYLSTVRADNQIRSALDNVDPATRDLLSKYLAGGGLQ